MSQQSTPLEQESGTGHLDPADTLRANLQQLGSLANENHDGAVALAQTLSAQLREAQDRISQLEREADSLGNQLLAEAKAIIQEVQSSADARVNRIIRETDERVDCLKAEAQHQIDRLQNELAQTKAEAGKRIESVRMEADARVETEANKRLDVIRCENERKVLQLEADLKQANNRADRAEQWRMLICREIEEHLMPIMRDEPKPDSSAARPWSLTVPTPSRSSASTWFRRSWVHLTAALGCRVSTDVSLTAFDRAPRHESGFSNGVTLDKTGDTATPSEPGAPLRGGGSSAALSSASAG